MTAMKRPGGAWLGWAAVLAVSLAQGALAASPIPAFPKHGTLTVQDVPDRFDKLRELLRGHRSPAGAKYHVAVVAFTDPLNREGPAFGDESGAYLDSVVEAWRQRADTENGVIILLGLRNREVRVHPFSRWVRLGWEGYAVVKTVNAARFRSFAQAGDYDTGMKELVLAIDAELARRLGAENEQVAKGLAAGEAQAANRLAAQAEGVQRTQDLIIRARAGVLSFESQVSQKQYVPPGARQAHAQAEAWVADAQRAFAEGDASKASELAERASRAVQEAARVLTGFEALDAAHRVRRRGLHARAVELEQSLVGAPFDVSRIRPSLESARLALDEAKTLLDAHSPEEAAVPLTKAEGSLKVAGELLVDARWAHELKTRHLPRLAVVVAVLALLEWLKRLRERSALLRREAQALIQQWETLLGQAAGNLLKLVDEHALFLGRADLVERFEGATAGPVREAAREVDDLFLSYDAAQRVLGAAKDELPRFKPLAWLRARPYARAIARLTAEEVVARTEDVTERKLFLPERREVRMTPKRLVSEMQSSWERVLGLVEKLEARFRSTWEEVDQLKGKLDALQATRGRLAELVGAPVSREETAKLEQELLALQERARRNPLGAEKESKGFASRLSKFGARTGQLMEMVSQLRGEVRQRRDDAGAALELLREQGLVIDAPGFELEAMLRHVDGLREEALGAVVAGRDEEAVAKTRAAAASASHLLERCEQALRVGGELAGRISEAEERVRTLEVLLPERWAWLRKLRQSHADSALQPVLDNAEKATGVLAEAARKLIEARASIAPAVKNHRAGAELLGQAVLQLDAVDALYQEIETRPAALALARQEAEKALAEAGWVLGNVGREVGKAAARKSTELENALREARNQHSELRGAAAKRHPDWPVLRQRATALAAEAASLRAEVSRASGMTARDGAG
jgi:hypothetical protein